MYPVRPVGISLFLKMDNGRGEVATCPFALPSRNPSEAWEKTQPTNQPTWPGECHIYWMGIPQCSFRFGSEEVVDRQFVRGEGWDQLSPLQDIMAPTKPTVSTSYWF